MSSLIIITFGLIVGSFLNAVIYRLHARRSLAEEHSICPKCKHELAAADLIPVVSFFLLRGKCRYCRKSISWQYPLVELATAAAFLLLLANSKYDLSNPNLWFHFILACFLIVIFVYDLKHYLILDKVLIPAVVIAATQVIWRGQLLEGIIGAVSLSGFFLIIYLVSRGRWIGFGDVKLGILLGFISPWPQSIAVFFLAYIIGAAIAVILLAFGRKGMGDKLPFGTFLTLAAFIAMLWGEEIITWYFRQIGLI